MNLQTTPRRILLGQEAVYYHFIPGRVPGAFILVHGIGVSSRYFIPLASEMAGGRDVYILDLPGYGSTPKPRSPLDIPTLGNAVAAVIDDLQLEDVVLVGHSMGCQISAHTAKISQQVRKLILMSPTANRRERSRLWQAFRLWQDSFKEPLWVNAVMFSDYFRMGPRRYTKTAQYMVQDKLEQSIESAIQPVRIIRGSRDLIAPHGWVAFLQSRVKECDLVEIPGGAHAVHMTHAREVARSCRDFAAAS